jgi:hypothetical protein
MENLDEIHDLIKRATLILVINNNSESMINSFINLIYKKYPNKKSKFNSTKGLMRKISLTKNKLIMINIDLNKLQFSSSNTSTKLWEDFQNIRNYAVENKLKILLRINQNPGYYKRYHDFFDLILLLDKKYIKTTKIAFNGWYLINNNDKLYDIDKLTRSTKLKQLKIHSIKNSCH